MVSTVSTQIFVFFDNLMIRSVPLPLTIGTITVLTCMQIRFCFYPPMYQFKIWVCAGVCVRGIGVVGGRGGALKNLSEMVGGGLEI